MRHTYKVNGWTDLGPLSFLFQPNVLIRAANLAAVSPYKETVDILDGSIKRDVFYEDNAGNRYFHELIPYVHPQGAGSVTIGTQATAADGSVTHTTTCEGKLITEAGAIAATGSAPHDANLLAGMLFSDYYTHFDGNYAGHENFHVTTIEEGDFLWVVRRGKVQLAATGTIGSAGLFLVTSGATDGAVAPAATINTAGTVAQYHASIIENRVGQPEEKGIALSLAAKASDLVWAELHLPYRYTR